MVDNDYQPPPAGHNNPPSDLEVVDPYHLLVVPPERLHELLDLKFGELVAQRDDLVAGVARWVAAHSDPEAHGGLPTIQLDGSDGPDALDFKRQLEAFTASKGEAETAREGVKRELLEASRIIQRWFVDFLCAPVEEKHQIVQSSYTRYLQQTERRRTEAAEKAAQEAAAEADRLAKVAAMLPEGGTREAVLDKVQQLSQQTSEAVEQLSGPLKDRSRERGFAGTVASLKEVWSWEVEQPNGKMDLIKAIAAGKESADLVLLNESMIGKIVRDKKLRRPIVGVKMTSSQRAT